MSAGSGFFIACCLVFIAICVWGRHDVALPRKTRIHRVLAARYAEDAALLDGFEKHIIWIRTRCDSTAIIFQVTENPDERQALSTDLNAHLDIFQQDFLPFYKRYRQLWHEERHPQARRLMNLNWDYEMAREKLDLLETLANSPIDS